MIQHEKDQGKVNMRAKERTKYRKSISVIKENKMISFSFSLMNLPIVVNNSKNIFYSENVNSIWKLHRFCSKQRQYLYRDLLSGGLVSFNMQCHFICNVTVF